MENTTDKEIRMEKLGCLTDEEKYSFVRSTKSDTEKCIMIGNATALFMRFKSITGIEIDFFHGYYHLEFNNFRIVVRNAETIELIFEKVEKAIIEKAVDGTL